MSIHQDIILDLLPTYFAGEASAETTKLVDAYFDQHPDFARTMRAAQQAEPVIPNTGQVNDGLQTVKRINKALKLRAGFLGASIGFSLAPFSFIFDSNKGGIVWLMLRDAPTMASVYLVAAVCMWLAYFNQRRNT